MKTIALILAALLLAGCAGLTTAWRFQMDVGYVTPQDNPAPAQLNPGKGS